MKNSNETPKCITFDHEAQENLPQHIKDKMKADRDKAREEKELTVYEYGAMSSRYKLKAANKLTAYATMVYHYGNSNHLIALYKPEENKKDSWLNPMGIGVTARLDEIFGGDNAFDKYADEHLNEISECLDTIEQIC